MGIPTSKAVMLSFGELPYQIGFKVYGKLVHITNGNRGMKTEIILFILNLLFV